MHTICHHLNPKLSLEETRKLAISAAFHDIGLWTKNTVDYLPPSIDEAMNFLQDYGLTNWNVEISEIIDFHHKVTSYRGTFALAELFRKADLADFSMGILRAGIPKDVFREICHSYPNAGFHRMLVRRSLQWLPRHPFNPMPILKW
jgi:hypothetical protein